MPLPTSYSDASLAEFMAAVVGSAADPLAWTVASGTYDEPVLDAIILYGGGITAVSQATDIPKLRTVARYAVWRAVADATSGLVDIATDQDSFKLSQVSKQATAALDRSTAALEQLGIGQPAITITRGRLAGRPDAYSTLVWGAGGQQAIEAGVLVDVSSGKITAGAGGQF
ncbi:MAG TPA: hypothetical protein VNM48_03870 [Chloroflexota bacterium]|nr:hypothetical protein [Chloroflexota bacterium]